MKRCDHVWEKQFPNRKGMSKYEICRKCLTRRVRIYNSNVRNWKYIYPTKEQKKQLRAWK